MRSLIRYLAMLLTCLATQAALAADVFLLNIPGIHGDVTLAKYTGWISVTAFSGAFENSSNAATGASCQQMGIVKVIDVASPALAMAVATEQRHPEVALVAVADSGGGNEFLRFTLRNALISSVAFGGDSSTSARTEKLTVSPQQIEVRYVPQNPDGAPGAPISTVVDCLGAS